MMESDSSGDTVDTSSAVTVSEEIRESWEEVYIPSKGDNSAAEQRARDQFLYKQKRLDRERQDASAMQKQRISRWSDDHEEQTKGHSKQFQRKKQQMNLNKQEQSTQTFNLNINEKHRNTSENVILEQNHRRGENVNNEKSSLQYVNQQNFQLLMQLNEQSKAYRQQEKVLVRLEIKHEKLIIQKQVDDEQLDEKSRTIDYLQERMNQYEIDLDQSNKKNKSLLEIIEQMKRRIIKEATQTDGKKTFNARENDHSKNEQQSQRLQEDLQKRMSKVEQLMADQLARSMSLQEVNTRLVKKYEDLLEQSEWLDKKPYPRKSQGGHQEAVQIRTACGCPGELLHQCQCHECEKCRKNGKYLEFVQNSEAAYFN